MIKDYLPELIKAAEASNNGWVHSGDVPRCNVIADGSWLRMFSRCIARQGEQLCM